MATWTCCPNYKLLSFISAVEPFQVYSMLQKVIPEVEKKKTKDMTADDKYSHLSNWSYLRPNMSYDFAVDQAVFAPSICKFKSFVS